MKYICPYVVYFYYYTCQTKNSILFNQITDKVRRNVKLSPLVNYPSYISHHDS